MIEEVVFYTLEKTIKKYRQFAQSRLDQAGLDITVDQWMVLGVIKDHPDLSQLEVAERVFKDQASIARITELLVRKGYLSKSPHDTDRRKSLLELTDEGQVLLSRIIPAVEQYRQDALDHISLEEVTRLKIVLEKIFQNCS